MKQSLQKVARKELTQNRSEYELEAVMCPYKEYCCNANVMLRRDLLAHKKEYIVEHTDMSLIRIKLQEKQNYSAGISNQRERDSIAELE